MAHFVGGRVLFNESFNASYFFLPIGSTLHTFTECNWRCWWKKWMEKHEEKEKMWRKRENGWKNSLTKWPISRQMVGEERCEAEEQENAPNNNIFYKNRNAHLIQLRTNDFDSAWWVIAIPEFAEQQQRPSVCKAEQINTCLWKCTKHSLQLTEHIRAVSMPLLATVSGLK